MAIEGTAVRAGSWTFAQAHLERSLHVQRSPTIAPSLLRNVRETERNIEGIDGALSAGVTGENSPQLQRVRKIQKAFLLAVIIVRLILANDGTSSSICEQAKSILSKPAGGACIAQSRENSEVGDE
jgi:hypothetical protein